MDYLDKAASWLANSLYGLWGKVGWIFNPETLTTKPLLILDIILVSFVFYWLYLFLKKTSASRYLPGFLIFACFAGLGQLLDLNAVSWLFSKLVLVLAVSIPIIFQPEIREALSLISKKNHRPELRSKEDKNEVSKVHNE